MGRIDTKFEQLKTDGRKGLITFITAGDPDLESTVELMHRLVDSGADLIELGVPFSDPMADGEVIQRASERALARATTLSDVLNCVVEFRHKDSTTPVVLMGYLNPYERMGAEAFANSAAEAGVDGTLVVDLPPEEAREFNQALAAHGLAQIFLVAPNSDDDRIRTICEYASGFVYFVSVKGVTGDKAMSAQSVNDRIAATRAIANVPVGVGFGIRTPESARAAAETADAIIVGSAIVEIIESNSAAATEEVGNFVGSLRQAIDGNG